MNNEAIKVSELGTTGLVQYVWGDARQDFTTRSFSLARLGVAKKILRSRGKDESAVGAFVKAVQHRTF